MRALLVCGLASIMFRSGGNTHDRLDKMNRIFSRRRLGENRPSRVVRLAASIFFAAGLVLGIVAVGADTSSPTQNQNLGALPLYQMSAGTHVTRADSESALNLQNTTEIPAQTEVGPPQMPAPATRSSFMASWPSVSGAIGYRLDVSTSNSFSSYVNGYHDLDVGNVTGRVVTGLSQDHLHPCLGSGRIYRQRCCREREPADHCVIREHQAVECERASGGFEHAAGDVRKRRGRQRRHI